MHLSNTKIQNKGGLAFGLWLIVTLAGCSSGQKNSLQVDVSDVQVDFQVTRLAPSLYETPESQFQRKLDSLYGVYPGLLDVYAGRVIGIGPLNKPEHTNQLKTFIYDKYWQEVYSEVQHQYPDISPLEGDLRKAFRHYRYYFPNDTIPDVYTMVKGIDLRYKVATVERESLLLFLDMYLGKDYKYYPSQYPEYRIERFQRAEMVPDVVETLFQAKYPEDDITGRTFLSKMVYRGKKLYFMKAMMPGRHDTAIMRYSLEDWEWCRTFEQKIWDHFVNEELLYETNSKKYSDFLKEAPFTSAGGIPPESPPRIGAFIGWQIIQKYQRNTGKQSLPSLMNNPNPKQLLTKSGYNP